VEWEVGVSGLADSSPSDPPRSKPYRMPALALKSSGALLERGARQLGLHPFPAPVMPGRGQPTMTIQALAFRAADHIGQFAKRNEI